MTPSAPYPGVLSYNSLATNSTISTSGSNSSNRSTLGSGLPAASAAPGSARPSFFSRSLGRRASKREPPRESPRSNSGSAISALPISNPSPLLYSSSSTTTTAPANLRSIGGPRMPGTLSSRASFDSRTSISSPIVSSPQINSHTGSPVTSSAGHPHRASFSYGSTTSSIASSPITYSNSNEGTTSSGSQDSAALSRLTDILPQANKEDLVRALKKAGGDDVLAISVYLSEEATKKGY